ncbi:MAG: hypothetical protein WC749_09025 [Dehalococcoidia bacterium]
MSTLIIGTRCTDGVVLAADRRELRGFEPAERCKVRKIEYDILLPKDESSKGYDPRALHCRDKYAKVSVLLAGAGVAAFWDEVAWGVSPNYFYGTCKTTDSVHDNKIRTLSDIIDMISLTSINLSGRYQSGSLDERLGCVVAGLSELTTGAAELWYFAGSGFSKTDFICLGSGDANALPMADLLLRGQGLTTEQTINIMPLIFMLVERVNISVAGGPDIFIVKDGMQPHQVGGKQVEQAKLKAGKLLERNLIEKYLQANYNI